jgi:glycosyltransferase involved in cell wall biosynthesis
VLTASTLRLNTRPTRTSLPRHRAAVSVVIPTYNSAQFLEEAIKSVLQQTYSDLDLVVVDDGSTDNTRRVVETFTDTRLRYAYQSNRGRSAARNLGLEISQGDYVAFLDADDFFLPDKLKIQVDLLDRDPSLGLVAAGHLEVDARGEPLRRLEPWRWRPTLTLESWFLGNPLQIQSVLVRRVWLERAGGFDQTFHYAEDWDLWLRLALLGCRMAWSEDVHSAYRFHAQNTIRDAERMKQGGLRVLDQVFRQPNLPPALAGLRAKAVAGVYFRSALQEYATGEGASARIDLSRALALDPSLLGQEGRALLEAVEGWAWHPYVDDPWRFVEVVFQNLPQTAAHLRRFRGQVLARVALDEMFTAYRKQDWHTALSSATAAVRFAPASPRLRNRGVLKVALLSALHSSSS